MKSLNATTITALESIIVIAQTDPNLAAKLLRSLGVKGIENQTAHVAHFLTGDMTLDHQYMWGDDLIIVLADRRIPCALLYLHHSVASLYLKLPKSISAVTYLSETSKECVKKMIEDQYIKGYEDKYYRYRRIYGVDDERTRKLSAEIGNLYLARAPTTLGSFTFTPIAD